jgi:ABC-2 type transport system ATP-binding protein
MNVLEVQGLSKSFGALQAVKNVSFNIPEGSVFGLIGRNGAGKTTTIRMLMNIYSPDSGSIMLRGKPVDREFNSRVGYLPEERGLYKKMKVIDTLMFFAELKGKTGKAARKEALEYLDRFQLLDRKDSKVEDLSKGNQQKVQFIATVLHDPEFLILDEPFSGLDPINTTILKDIILDLKKQGKVIIFSTHLMDFAEMMCDHIAIINKGEIIEQGTMGEIKAKYSKNNIQLVYEGNLDFLQSNKDILSVEDFGNSTGIRVASQEAIQPLLKSLIENNVQVKRFDSNDISLHEVFVHLAGDLSEEEVA